MERKCVGVERRRRDDGIRTRFARLLGDGDDPVGGHVVHADEDRYLAADVTDGRLHHLGALSVGEVTDLTRGTEDEQAVDSGFDLQ